MVMMVIMMVMMVRMVMMVMVMMVMVIIIVVMVVSLSRHLASDKPQLSFPRIKRTAKVEDSLFQGDS